MKFFLNWQQVHFSAPVVHRILRMSLTCTAVALRSIFTAALTVLSVVSTVAQDSTLKRPNITATDSAVEIKIPADKGKRHIPAPMPGINSLNLPDRPAYPYNKKRIRLVTIGNIAGYGSTLVGFYSAWYRQYPQTNFHSFNDSREWLQVDKVGHFYGAYIGSYGSTEMWRWTGLPRNKRIWIGGLSGAAYQTVIETLDGFSAGWGWSWSDIGANLLGSGAVIAQELAWDEQRIKFKFSFHQRNYGDAELNRRADKLFGKSPTERFIKDYNAQTYWASINLKSFFPKSKLPRWLNVAVGYGAEGLFGAENNIGKDDNGNINFNRPDIKRYRQWFIAPDIDLTKIKSNKKGIRLMLGILNAFKFPAPSLEFSNGSFKVSGLHF